MASIGYMLSLLDLCEGVTSLIYIVDVYIMRIVFNFFPSIFYDHYFSSTSPGGEDISYFGHGEVVMHQRKE